MKSGNIKVARLKARRALRVRAHITGTEQRPRMCVVKSNKHIYVQLIDDVTGRTLVSEQTVGRVPKEKGVGKKSKTVARSIGESIAHKAKAAGITHVIFDRGPFKYHGILAELADGARQQGLIF
jgi:large subunit ribosomal protein L18